MFERRERTGHEEHISLGKGENIGLQGRLLTGQKFLDPKTEFKKGVKWQDLNITPETYKPLERLSQLERKQYWKDQAPDKDLPTQKQIWAQNVVSVIEGKKSFFESEEGKKRKELYGRLGVNLDGFNQDSALAMYNHFFAADRKGHEVEKFAEEVLDLDIYKDPNDENALNFPRVKEDLEALTWLGSIFGPGSAFIITEMIAAEARICDKKEEQIFAKQLDKKDKWLGRGKRRIDKLNEFEEGVLEYVNEANKTDELKVPEKLQKYIKIPVINIPSDFLPPPPADLIENSGWLDAASEFTKKAKDLVEGWDKKLQHRANRAHARRHNRKQSVRYEEWRD